LPSPPATLCWWKTSELPSGKNAGQPGRVAAGLPRVVDDQRRTLNVLVITLKPITMTCWEGVVTPGPAIGLKAMNLPSGEKDGVPGP